jgi:chromate transporter
MQDRIVERTKDETTAPPSLGEMTRVFGRIGLLSFGGPAGQIALMHKELVDDRRWISEPRFLHALNFCMLLPGPEAQQLATYVGWLLHGVRGGLIAGTLFVLPGFFVILGLSIAYVLFQDATLVAGIFFGLKAAVLAIVIEALVKVARRALKTRAAWVIAGLAFAAVYVFGVPFPLVILAAAVAGFMGARGTPPAAETEAVAAPVGLGRIMRTIAIGLALWAAPVAGLALVFGGDSVFVPIASFFSQMAVVTFGGAYAVLAYVAQEAVGGFGWLRPGEMLDGLALAETTPGPLVLVLSFVGFLAAFRDPGVLDPLVAGVIGAALTTWVTFVPCFLWIFLGAPYVERLRRIPALAGALQAITAAVVGVILNLTVWFGLHVLFRQVAVLDLGPAAPPVPVLATLDPWALLLSLAALAALLWLKVGLIPTLAAAAIAGLALQLLA